MLVLCPWIQAINFVKPDSDKLKLLHVTVEKEIGRLVSRQNYLNVIKKEVILHLITVKLP